MPNKRHKQLQYSRNLTRFSLRLMNYSTYLLRVFAYTCWSNSRPLYLVCACSAPRLVAATTRSPPLVFPRRSCGLTPAVCMDWSRLFWLATATATTGGSVGAVVSRHSHQKYIHRGSLWSFCMEDSNLIQSIWSSTPVLQRAVAVNHGIDPRC